MTADKDRARAGRSVRESEIFRDAPGGGGDGFSSSIGAEQGLELFGDQGKDLTFPGRPEIRGLDSRGRGVRLKPDAFRLEGLSSRTQYGNAFDAYGHFFAHNNSIHQRHEVIAARYLERNPHLLLPSAMAEISDHGNNNIRPITHGARYDLLTEPGQFTSACALTVYGGGAFPSSSACAR